METSTINTSTKDTITIDTNTLDTNTLNTNTIDTNTMETITLNTSIEDTITIDTNTIKSATDCNCGLPKKESNFEISGGREAIPHEFPWIVRIRGGCSGMQYCIQEWKKMEPSPRFKFLLFITMLWGKNMKHHKIGFQISF